MALPSFSLKDKVAIVTGASRGIGKAIALGFAEAGADVALCSRHLPDLEKVAQEIRALGRCPLAVETDIAVKAQVDNLVQRTVEELGTVDILVNIPALNILVPLIEMREEGWDKIMNTSLKGYFLASQAAGRVMAEKRSGNIINIVSTGARRATGRLGAYCIAKAGVVMLTQVLALELGPYNIRVNALGPTLIKTEFSRALWTDPDYVSKRLSEIPLSRLGETEDMVGAAIFLASEASSYITGQTIYVDGGLLA